jgi:hypothetical protein
MKNERRRVRVQTLTIDIELQKSGFASDLLWPFLCALRLEILIALRIYGVEGNNMEKIQREIAALGCTPTA